MDELEASSRRIEIRPAIPADAELIVHFVKELAKFENEPLENVKLTPEIVSKDGFGSESRFEVLIAEVSGKPVGMALFFSTYSTWTAKPGIWVEELFVEEEHRSTGVGRQLLSAVVELAKERDYGRVELAVLKWNPAVGFYEHMGFEPMREWQTYRLSAPFGDLQASPKSS